MYPHAITAVLSSSSRDVIRRNSALLPAYSLVLAFLTLLGFMAIAVGVKGMPAYAPMFAHYKNSFAVPALFLSIFPAWFVGFAFAAIGIGALVPAAIMSIAAANLWTRNVHLEFINPRATAAQEAQMAKWVSLIVKIGALYFILAVNSDFAIVLQLLGGVWMIQIFPALIFGLFTRWFSGAALFVGWLVGIVLGTVLSYTPQPDGTVKWLPVHKLAGDLPLVGHFDWGFAAYNGLTAVALNAVLAALLSLVLRSNAPDETRPEDYLD
jgi:SSS family solute:Na+ symporter